MRLDHHHRGIFLLFVALQDVLHVCVAHFFAIPRVRAELFASFVSGGVFPFAGEDASLVGHFWFYDHVDRRIAGLDLQYWCYED